MRKQDVYRRILKMLYPYTGLLILSILCGVGSVAGALYLPILTGKAIDLMLGEGLVDMQGILDVLKQFAVTIVVYALSQYAMTLINNRVSFLVGKSLRSQIFETFHKVSVSTLERFGQGDLLSRMISDTERVCDGLLLGFSQLFTGILTIVGTLLFMIYQNGMLSLVVILLTPVSLFVASFISKRTYQYFTRQTKLLGTLTTHINETVSSVSVIRDFDAQSSSVSKLEEINEEYASTNLKALFFSSITNPATRFVNNLVYAGVGVFGALLSVNARLTIGTLTCFLSYANQYTKPFNEISGVLTEFQNAIASGSRIFSFLAEPAYTDAVTLPDSAKESFEGDVEVSHLYFGYDKSKMLLTDISFHVKPGSHIAIVGPTGCGKTTFINLLMRFLEPDRGSILLDNISLSDIPKEILRKNIGMVLQDTWLKEGTVRDNIAYGKPDATMEEIIEAAKRCHAHSFIKRLENGYDTYLATDGGNLSAGQKQLICIARVMLMAPPLLILDEATSSIDTRTELKVNDAFLELMKGRTSFIVAHRLSTIRNADLILVMKDGNIVEQGTHEELIEKRGFYYEMNSAK